MLNAKADRFMSYLRPLQGPLEGVCRKLAWDPAGWQDTLQNAVLIAWSRFDRYDPAKSFKAWVFSILFNTALNANRAYQQKNRHEESWPSESIDFFQKIAAEDAYLEVLKNPTEVVGQFRPEIESALRELSSQEKGTFLMRSLGEMKYAEIAEALGLPIGTVMSHLHRARMKLREKLAEDFVSRREAQRNDP